MTAARRTGLVTIGYYYPFTFTGTLILALAVYLLGSAFASKSNYAFFFAVLLFLLLIILAILARIQAFRMATLRLLWDSSVPIISRIHGQTQTLHAGDRKPFFFFRLHFVLKGRLHAGRGADLYFYREASASDSSAVSIPVYFPVCGELNVRGRLVLHDLFGFVRARLGSDEFRSIVVRPTTFTERIKERFDVSFSLESSRNLKSSDEEKYYMREYIPGDRMKDINWKTSFRVSQLITRISPMSPEKSKVLFFEFRHCSSEQRETPVSILHLNYLKSWLLSFLYSLKRSDEAFRFVVATADSVFELDTEAQIDQFAVDLGPLPYVAGNASSFAPDYPTNERIVFTTPYDHLLRTHVASHSGVHFRTFRTSHKKSKKARRVRFFDPFVPDVLPGLWYFRPSRKGERFETVPGVEEELDVRLI